MFYPEKKNPQLVYKKILYEILIWVYLIYLSAEEALPIFSSFIPCLLVSEPLTWGRLLVNSHLEFFPSWLGQSKSWQCSPGLTILVRPQVLGVHAPFISVLHAVCVGQVRAQCYPGLITWHNFSDLKWLMGPISCDLFSGTLVTEKIVLYAPCILSTFFSLSLGLSWEHTVDSSKEFVALLKQH